jgi:hypothetical protein
MRNLTTFDSGNRAGLKLAPQLHQQFVQIVQQTGRISVVSGKCGLGVSTARHWMSRGRNEESGPYREFLDDVERARSDFLLLANRRLNQMATGGLIRLPAFDKSGSPIPNHREGCGAEPGCGSELKILEKVMMPDSRILMWQVDRIDPLPNGDAAAAMSLWRQSRATPKRSRKRQSISISSVLGFRRCLTSVSRCRRSRRRRSPSRRRRRRSSPSQRTCRSTCATRQSPRCPPTGREAQAVQRGRSILTARLWTAERRRPYRVRSRAVMIYVP